MGEKGFLTGGFVDAEASQVLLLARALGAPVPFRMVVPDYEITDRASAAFALRAARVAELYGKITTADRVEVEKRALPFLLATSVQRTVDDVRRVADRGGL